MPPERLLRTCMLGLVLFDLAFVYMTGAAGGRWLVPLTLLTLAAPFLARLREFRVYRAAWNLGVIGIFALLVRHAMRADLAYVLEQGLVLAVFCQVHLLNNLRSLQAPDLLFVNAFLIAIIAAFMSTGTVFPVAFLAFAGLFVVGLQLLSASRGRRPTSPEAARALVLDGLRRAAVTVVCSLAVFLFWPRDFHRKAFFHGRIDFNSPSPSDSYEVGFNEELALDRKGPVSASDRTVLQVTLLEGPTSAVSPLWRGATLGETDGNSWRALGAHLRFSVTAAADEPWTWEGEAWSRGGDEPELPAVSLRVERLDMGTERLFAPLGARGLASTDRNVPRAQPDGTFKTSSRGPFGYTLELPAGGPATALAGALRSELPDHLAPYAELPEKSRLLFVHELAANLTAPLDEDVEQHELVARVAAHLEQTYEYAPPGSEGAARTLEEFLSGEAPGHCEFFASALATMLRSRGVPCRVVTGLRSTRWSNRTLLFAMRDAHAWVEVHDPAAGWYSVDPSPLTVAGVEGESLWARMRTGVREFWGAVTGFDDEARAEFLASLRTLPSRGLRAVREQPVTTVGVPALAALFLLYRRHLRRRSVPLAQREYERAVRTTGLTLRAGETPRELLRRAREWEPPVKNLPDLELATRTHEEARYASVE